MCGPLVSGRACGTLLLLELPPAYLLLCLLHKVCHHVVKLLLRGGLGIPSLPLPLPLRLAGAGGGGCTLRRLNFRLLLQCPLGLQT